MNSNKYIYILGFILLFSGCKKDFLERPPLSRQTVENSFNTGDDAKRAIVAVYARLQGMKFYDFNYSRMVELASDDIIYNEASNSDDVAIDNFNWSSNMGTTVDFWPRVWEGVQRANLVLDRVPAISMDENEKRTILAEARFLRAFFYWHLATDFGDVPLYTSVPTGAEDLYRPETSRRDIYAFLAQDLAAVQSDLPTDYPASETGRATRWALKSLLGKLYIYLQDWNSAKTVLGEVINSSGKRLVDFPLNFDATTENGQESIFEIQYSTGFTDNPIGIYFIDGGISGEGSSRGHLLGIKTFNQGAGQLIATKDIFNEFEPGDPRLNATLWQVGDPGLIATGGAVQAYSAALASSMPFPSRTGPGNYYNVKKGIPGVNSTGAVTNEYPNNIVLFRLGDIKLLYAEALAESGDLGTAKDQLNQLRTFRRGSLSDTILPNFPYTTKYGGNRIKGSTAASPAQYPGEPKQFNEGFNLNDFRTALVHERRVELAFEYQRFNDMKRWARLDRNHPGSAFKVFSEKGEPKSKAGDKKDFQDRNLLWPKPLLEVDKSRGTLKQNPGY
ncbi:MAG TPA: RagB/SusD family nutrient uptake outer membrane protein [Cytophagaceae bacterium]|jgi:hypothetical protein